MIKVLFADGTSIRLEGGLELPLEPLISVKVILKFESGLTVIADLPDLVGIIEEEE